MSERKVQEALHLLEEAGRLDLLQGGVGGSSRPPRRTSGGVAAAVLACSTARDGGRRQAVSRRGRGRFRGRAGGELARGGPWRPTGLLPGDLQGREVLQCAPGPLRALGCGRGGGKVWAGPEDSGAGLAYWRHGPWQ
ncbi:hypothetical protein NDU88_006953 [Pleurodeles waltl]|uniref:Uncharacterized protein n=1 Tax=Pleurodeles waltl TaxID=8319 RepID=A0AAV7PMJ6_PLEWA|nr:hypothetical protein NDU88_006953 [Pleurodeles waltl]